MTLKVLDLFSGIGTFSYALDQIEHDGKKVFETVAFCEIDTDCHRVLKKHWPEVPIFTDVSQMSNCHIFQGEDYLQQHDQETGLVKTEVYSSDIDVIVGGFPCTDISVAGSQKGLVDEKGNKTRSGLWSEYKRIISEIKPRYVLIENVRNLLSNGIGTVLKDLSEIGYDAEWEVISARDVGQCHLRERVWIVAYPNGKHLRDVSERGRSTERSEARIGYDGQDGDVRDNQNIITDTDCNGRVQGIPLQTRDEGKSLQPSRTCEERNTADNDEGSSERDESSNTDYFRFWPAFATEEEKSEWWAEATSEYCDWREAQPEVRGVYDGPTSRLHEKFRRGRVKQLGNGIVRSIAQLHGERIKYHEFSAESFL